MKRNNQSYPGNTNLIIFVIVGMCWALFLIGLHDDIQEKILQEIDEVLGDDKERSPTFRELNEMKYLERVLKESLRIYPSVPSIARKVSENITIGS